MDNAPKRARRNVFGMKRDSGVRTGLGIEVLAMTTFTNITDKPVL